VPRALYEQMIAHAVATLPNECCGALAGVIQDSLARVTQHYPLTNAAASPKRYYADEKALFAANRDTHERGTEFLALYHSHPTAAPTPSKTDLEESYWRDVVVYLIISLQSPTPEVRGWWLTENDYREADWDVVD
jgi:proteasome lid subunit RPN8/RPN11